MTEKKGEKSRIAEREELTRRWWQERQIFEKSLAKPAPAGEVVFYDGPPFATGRPHYGHILPGTIKDIIPRYLTMRGRRVPRRWGWDCHGLPVENLVEQELGLETKKDIENYGIARFNERARASVLRYEKEWREIIPRTGRWVDMAGAYKTMDPPYTEAVWWSFKTLYDQGLIYQGFKSMHLCPRCETTLSNFEVSQNYREIGDVSAYVKFELVDEPGTFLLAWTTTPWTLPGNAALAVKADARYRLVQTANGKFIILSDKIEKLFSAEPVKILGEFAGAKLIDKKYKSLFSYYQTEGRVATADFVSTAEGTGIVHIAPAFGDDDYQLSLREKLPLLQPVTTDGRFKPEVSDFAGLAVKPKDNHQATDLKIVGYLEKNNSLFRAEKIVHSYPHCWRCDTPLLNYAASSWFLKVTAVKDKMLAENQKVQWVPEDLRDGRFGHWLAGARDWALSRSRFWGAPLPVWRCALCGKDKVIGSLTELAAAAAKSGNRYFVMRHGEADSNVKNIFSAKPKQPHHLTENGRRQVAAAAEKLKGEKIDLIFASDFIRTRETAESVRAALELGIERVVYDERLRELDYGELDGRAAGTLAGYFHSTFERFIKAPPGGENLSQVKGRVSSLLYDLEAKQQEKNILLVTHDLPAAMLLAGAAGLDAAEAAALRDSEQGGFDLAECRRLNFAPGPHNSDYELDLHRPYIDELVFSCHCGGKMKRVAEVFDVWYESGAVPFASTQSKELIPADFIAESLDQTRGWFYTLLVLGVALFGKTPYRRVVTSGLILAADGRKMSKRLKNYPELEKMLDRYGADALRCYLMSSPAVRAGELLFSEKSLDEVAKKIILRLENVLAFYTLYSGDQASAVAAKSSHLLDRWLFSRLSAFQAAVTAGLDDYQIDRAVRPLFEFVEDLSTWYLRRSRERLKSGDEEERAAALRTMRQALRETAKISAPFMPFLAEEIYQKVKTPDDAESVHLADWPKPVAADEDLLSAMTALRRLVSLGLERRTKEKIKIRQPLAKLMLRQPLADAYLPIIKDELNVKEVVCEPTLATALDFDFAITPALKEAGDWRELVRSIQAERKRTGLRPGQSAVLTLNEGKRSLVAGREAELKKLCALSEIKFDAQCPIVFITPKG